MKTIKPKKLETLDIPVIESEAKPKGGSDKLVVSLAEDSILATAVQAYNQADLQEKKWKKVKTETRPLIEEVALDTLYSNNCEDGAKTVKTVRIVDATGSAVNVTLKDTYGNLALDKKVAIDLLTKLRKSDPNEYLQEKVKVEFDSSVFYESDGTFRTDFYMDFIQAVAEVAKSHEVKSPISSSKYVAVKSDFATRRWTDFRDSDQAELSTVFAPTVSLTPVAPE